MDKERLSELAKENRERIIKEFYDQQKEHFEESAKKGYGGFSVSFDSLGYDLKSALRSEESRLTEIITDIDMKLKRRTALIGNHQYVAEVVFRWE